MRYLCIVWFLLWHTAVFAEYLHSPTGLSLPDRLGTLTLGETKDIEREKPGLGVSVRYDGNHIKADIFLYTFRHNNIPDGVDDKLIPQEFKNTLAGILLMEKLGKYTAAKILSDSPTTIGQQPALGGLAEYREDGVPKLSHVLLTGYKSHFVKVRYTYDAADKERGMAEFAEFAKDLGKLLQTAPELAWFHGGL